MSTPAELKYTKDHEWIKVDGNKAIIGVTDFAQRELGDIVFVEVETVGQTLNAGDVFGSVEAVKTVSDLYLPVSGIIDELNEDLASAPESINQNPYSDGWIIKMTLSNPEELNELLDAKAYDELTA